MFRVDREGRIIDEAPCQEQKTLWTDVRKPNNPNPKDLIGAKKISTYVFPPAALLHASYALMDGAGKYGPYNWRDNAVQASIYLDACERHKLAWQEGEECASDSLGHHLGHAIACLAILLDAQESGNLIDDRPKHGQATIKLLAQLNEKVKNKK